MIMKNFSLNFNLIYFHYLFLLALFTFYSTIGSTQKIPIPSDPIGDIVCEAVHCGQGVCKASNETLLGFDCECNPGWKKIPIGPFTYPACVIPNCTVNFQCDGSASPPPPPAPMVPPPGCEFVWCGDGTCVANGTGHVCQCPEGTWNLLDMPGLACFKACYLGGDCKSKGFVAPASEKSYTASSLKNSVTLTVALLISILLTWI